MGIMSAIRNMIGCTTTDIYLDYYLYGKMKCDKDSVNDIRNQLRKNCPDFYGIYEENFQRDAFTVEDAYQNAVFSHFTEMANMNNINVHYNDVVVHLRIVVDGIDEPTRHGTPHEHSSHVVSHQGSSVIITLDKFRYNETNEYWEFYVTM